MEGSPWDKADGNLKTGWKMSFWKKVFQISAKSALSIKKNSYTKIKIMGETLYKRILKFNISFYPLKGGSTLPKHSVFVESIHLSSEM